MVKRKIDQIIKGLAMQDGAGVKLTRVLSRNTVESFDPFLMLDAFDSKNPQDYIKGFPWHPHRGIETLTYLIEGKIEHGDSLGNHGVINGGGAQWMSAGSGVIHQEMPNPVPHMYGMQLWINLPADHKMSVPTYRDIKPESVPSFTVGGAHVKIIAGEYMDKHGAAKGDYVKPNVFDVTLKPGSLWNFKTGKTQTVFIYLLKGQLFCGEDNKEEIPANHAVLFKDGDAVELRSGDKDTRFMFFAADPLKEPVAWGGPIVMNTREELKQAFSELDAGTFIKHSHPDFKKYSR